METAKRVTKVKQHSDRLILVKIQADPVDLVIVQVYMPTSDHSDEEVEELYEEMEGLIAKEKGNDYLVILGDWNAVVGEEKVESETSRFGLGKRNDRGQMIVEFCRRMKLKITNTRLHHDKRRRYTWKKAGDTGRYQLDYILVRQRYGNTVKNSRSYPGADVDSDHNLVLMDVKIRFKKIKRSQKWKKWKLEGIDEKAAAFQKEVSKRLSVGCNGQGRSVEEDW
jgi:exonuclease III